jgi:hypothetical protein
MRFDRMRRMSHAMDPPLTKYCRYTAEETEPTERFSSRGTMGISSADFS